MVGKNLEEAKGLVSQSGFDLEVSEKFSDLPEGTVISQKPDSGSRVKRGKLIVISVSKGAERTSAKEVPTDVETDLSEGLGEATPEAFEEDSEDFEDLKVTSFEFIVCIDPGHQGHADNSPESIGPGSTTTKERCRGGGTGVNSRTPEYEIVLQIGLKLKKMLESEGIKVVMVRTTNDVNISNSERAQIANEAKADLFVRIHCNGSSSTSSNGIMTLYPSRNEWCGSIYDESRKAAQLIQREMVIACGRANKGIIARGDITGFNWSQVPVVLSEICFLSNPEEDTLLNDESFQNKAARGLFNGIVKYLK